MVGFPEHLARRPECAISLAPNFGKVDAIMVRDEQQLAEVREKLTNNNFR